MITEQDLSMPADYLFIAKNISSCLNELQLDGCSKMVEGFIKKYDTPLSDWLTQQLNSKMEELKMLVQEHEHN